jgi:hypothetical protein
MRRTIEATVSLLAALYAQVRAGIIERRRPRGHNRR